MRLNINLASQPYEDARMFWLRWGSALVAAAIVTLALVAITISGWFAARRDHATIAGYRAEIAQRDRTRQQAEDFLNRPENRETRDESQFVNSLIDRKALSWTLVLEDLERVMPARVHVVSIRPEMDENNQLTVKLVVGGDSREKAIDLARRMEESRHFSQTYIETEHAADRTQGGAQLDAVQFNIAGVYLPTVPPAADSKSTKEKTDKTADKADKPDKNKKDKTDKKETSSASKKSTKPSKKPGSSKPDTSKNPKPAQGSKP